MGKSSATNGACQCARWSHRRTRRRHHHDLAHQLEKNLFAIANAQCMTLSFGTSIAQDALPAGCVRLGWTLAAGTVVSILQCLQTQTRARNKNQYLMITLQLWRSLSCDCTRGRVALDSGCEGRWPVECQHGRLESPRVFLPPCKLACPSGDGQDRRARAAVHFPLLEPAAGQRQKSDLPASAAHALQLPPCCGPEHGWAPAWLGGAHHEHPSHRDERVAV